MYIQKHGQTNWNIWNYATGTLTPTKCTPMQVLKETEQWKASTNEEQK